MTGPSPLPPLVVYEPFTATSHDCGSKTSKKISKNSLQTAKMLSIFHKWFSQCVFSSKLLGVYVQCYLSGRVSSCEIINDRIFGQDVPLQYRGITCRFSLKWGRWSIEKWEIFFFHYPISPDAVALFHCELVKSALALQSEYIFFLSVIESVQYQNFSCSCVLCTQH